MEFQKKYKYLNMAHYMHKAHLEEVKNKEKAAKENPKEKNLYNTEGKLMIFAKTLIQKQKIGLDDEKEKPKIDSYLKACIYNDSELIKAYLLAAKSKKLT